MQNQSQRRKFYKSLLYQGIDKTEKKIIQILYDRVNVLLCEDLIEMD
jgi:hypothetical protein